MVRARVGRTSWTRAVLRSAGIFRSRIRPTHNPEGRMGTSASYLAAVGTWAVLSVGVAQAQAPAPAPAAAQASPEKPVFAKKWLGNRRAHRAHLGLHQNFSITGLHRYRPGPRRPYLPSGRRGGY